VENCESVENVENCESVENVENCESVVPIGLIKPPTHFPRFRSSNLKKRETFFSLSFFILGNSW
jgi:hypothetical protein